MQKPATPDGLFHEGDPLSGTRGTPLSAAFLNGLLQISTFFSGNAEPPDPALGDDNDFYFCTVSRNFYGPKFGGLWGAAWIQGIPGKPGTQWYWGPGDPGVIPGQFLGDYYVDAVSGNFWQLAATGWAVSGNLRGRPVSSAPRDPLAADGADGDFWCNTATLTIFIKAGGAWSVGQALVGPQGIQGAAGGPVSAVWADVQVINRSMALNGYDVIYLGDTTAGVLVWTAPSAVGQKGRRIYVENIGTTGSNLTLNGSGAQTIDGNVGEDLPNGMGRTYFSDGANWRVLKG